MTVEILRRTLDPFRQQILTLRDDAARLRTRTSALDGDVAQLIERVGVLIDRFYGLNEELVALVAREAEMLATRKTTVIP